MLDLWGMRSNLSLPSLPGPLCLRVVAPDRVLSMSQIELNCVIMLNWIVWNRTVFDIFMLNWIAWNRTVSAMETVFMLSWIVWNRTVFYIQLCVNKKLYLHWTKLFEIELFIWIKMELPLLTYNGWCAVKLNQTKSNHIKMHLKVRVLFWSFGECGVLHSDPNWVYLFRSHQRIK